MTQQAGWLGFWKARLVVKRKVRPWSLYLPGLERGSVALTSVSNWAVPQYNPRSLSAFNSSQDTGFDYGQSVSRGLVCASDGIRGVLVHAESAVRLWNDHEMGWTWEHTEGPPSPVGPCSATRARVPVTTYFPSTGTPNIELGTPFTFHNAG